jgi:hypothetical protein
LMPYSYDRTAKRLKVLRPTPVEVLYLPPNPDGSRKLCKNCYIWVKNTERCVIHASDKKIAAGAVCSYHVYGKPITSETAKGFKNVEPVDPSLSGLMTVDGGTSCDVCKFYIEESDDTGTCKAVADPKDQEKDAGVDALGCCSRWDQ